MEYGSDTNLKKAIGLGCMDHTWRAAFRGDHHVTSIVPKTRIDGFLQMLHINHRGWEMNPQREMKPQSRQGS